MYITYTMTAARAVFAAGWHQGHLDGTMRTTSSQDSAPTKPQEFVGVQKKATDDAQAFVAVEKKATDDASDSPRARERQWCVLLSCVVAGMLNLTVGVTLSIPSNVILDLTRENSLIGDSAIHQLTTFQQSIFAVS